MYQSIYIEKPKQGKPLVHIWDDKKGYEKFQFTPYAYQKSPTGQHRSLYGDKLKKVKFWTGDDLQNGDIILIIIWMVIGILETSYYET